MALVELFGCERCMVQMKQSLSALLLVDVNQSWLDMARLTD